MQPQQAPTVAAPNVIYVNTSSPFKLSVKAVLGFVVAIVAVVGFVVTVGGLGDLHEECNDSYYYDSDDCEERFRFWWWTTFYQLIAFIAVGVVSLTELLENVRHAVIFFLSVATVQLILGAERFIDGEESAEDAAAAGFIISAIANFALILVVGVTGTPTMKMPQFAWFGAAAPALQPQGSAPMPYPVAQSQAPLQQQGSQNPTYPQQSQQPAMYPPPGKAVM